ncbi:LysR family transcriptional regulator [Nitratireductor luteus]|uniref:LysR family transcriptional regulator n=1 Tax=Nitratireductor luteus TaxID=2976980 RepID=UPI00224059A2|nr:LysR family transcriptional regulator [Nitratireductor luteus]
MNLTFLETFIWAARLKSFTLTAERMNATQAAVSARIAALERELGVKLFYREPREVRLTPDGVSALERAEGLVRAAHELIRDIGAQERLRGTVRIGAIDTISHSWLIDLIKRSKTLYPHINIELTADTSLRLTDMLLGNELDVALIMGPVLQPDVINVDLCTYACSWTASPDLGLHDRQLDVDDLASFPIISFPKGSQPHEALRRYFHRHLEAGTVLYATNSLATIIRMTIDGIGVAAIPPPVMSRELRRGELVPLNVRQPFPPMSFQAVYVDSPTFLLPAAVANLAREVAREFCSRSDPSQAW